MATGKGQASATIAEAPRPTQTFWWCVDIGYSTPLRLSNGKKTVISSNTYYPWSFNVGKVSCRGSISESLAISFFNGTLTAPYTSQRLSELDYSDDARGCTITVYRVQEDEAGAQSSETYFSGTVNGTDVSERQWKVKSMTAASLRSLRGCNVDIGLCRWRKYGNTDCGITPDFTGTGNDDLTVEDFGEVSSQGLFEIEIEVGGGDPTSPNTYQWRFNAGAWTTGVSCHTAAAELQEGFEIAFGATTGHDDGDAWQIDGFCTMTYDDCAGALTGSNKSNELRFGGLRHSPVAGEKILIPGVSGYITSASNSPKVGFGRNTVYRQDAADTINTDPRPGEKPMPADDYKKGSK